MSVGVGALSNDAVDAGMDEELTNVAAVAVIGREGIFSLVDCCSRCT